MQEIMHFRWKQSETNQKIDLEHFETAVESVNKVIEKSETLNKFIEVSKKEKNEAVFEIRQMDWMEYNIKAIYTDEYKHIDLIVFHFDGYGDSIIYDPDTLTAINIIILTFDLMFRMTIIE
jgi:hypothetical protein